MPRGVFYTSWECKIYLSHIYVFLFVSVGSVGECGRIHVFICLWISCWPLSSLKRKTGSLTKHCSYLREKKKWTWSFNCLAPSRHSVKRSLFIKVSEMIFAVSSMMPGRYELLFLSICLSVGGGLDSFLLDPLRTSPNSQSGVRNRTGCKNADKCSTLF